jgi:hypothetical protein
LQVRVLPGAPKLPGHSPNPITGQPAALRVLADACQEAAAMAEEYDADPDAFNERERAERD